MTSRAGHKSFFASFFSKKEESSFSEEKEAKRLLCPAPVRRGAVFLKHSRG
jgi:hypothetical protein